MLEWFFVIYLIGQPPRVITEVYTQPTEARCVNLWREKIEQFRITHPEAIITSCRETKDLIVIKPEI